MRRRRRETRRGRGVWGGRGMDGPRPADAVPREPRRVCRPGGTIRRGRCDGHAFGLLLRQRAGEGASDGPPRAPWGARGAEEPLWKRPVSSCGRIAASGGVRSPSRACAVLAPGASATVDCGECAPLTRPRRLDPRSKIPSTGPAGHPMGNRESPSERVDLRRFPQSYAQRIHSRGEFAGVGGAPC